MMFLPLSPINREVFKLHKTPPRGGALKHFSRAPLPSLPQILLVSLSSFQLL
ncbi:hypothetical protein ACE6H2_022728 [Prunus campanulata]